MSKYVWSRPGPRRICKRAFSVLMRPLTRGDSISSRASCATTFKSAPVIRGLRTAEGRAAQRKCSRVPSGEAGLLPSIWVDNIDATLALVAAHGGEIVEAPHHDAPEDRKSTRLN